MFFLTNYWIILLIPFLIILPLYLSVEKLGRFRLATTLKLTLTALCVASALIGYLTMGSYYREWRLLLVGGLGIAMVADYFLQYIKLDIRKFIAGILCFSLTQICFIIYLVMLYGIGWQEFVITAVILLLVLRLMNKQRWELGRARVALSMYTVLLTFMASKSVTVLFTAGHASVSMMLMAAGGVCFLLADLCLGTWNYHSGKRIHVNLNWIFYFSAIMLIALSNYLPFILT